MIVLYLIVGAVIFALGMLLGGALVLSGRDDAIKKAQDAGFDIHL